MERTIFGIFTSILAIPSLTLTVFGWVALTDSKSCDNVPLLNQYIHAVAISSTILLVLFLIGIFFALMSNYIEIFIVWSIIYNGFIILILTILNIIFNITWIIWGVIILSQITSDNPCKGTFYYIMTLIIVVTSGIFLFIVTCALNIRLRYAGPIYR